MMRTARGFTLVELMIVLAVIAVILTLAAPSLYNYILMQRLKAVSAQLVSDIQFARSEAVARNEFIRLHFPTAGPTDDTCYTIFIGPDDFSCNCLTTPVCPTGSQEIRTVTVRRSSGVTVSSVSNPPWFKINPLTAVVVPPSGFLMWVQPKFEADVAIDNERRLRTEVKISGRPGVCTPTGSTMPGPAC